MMAPLRPVSPTEDRRGRGGGGPIIVLTGEGASSQKAREPQCSVPLHASAADVTAIFSLQFYKVQRCNDVLHGLASPLSPVSRS